MSPGMTSSAPNLSTYSYHWCISRSTDYQIAAAVRGTIRVPRYGELLDHVGRVGN
jgi:hypothetical protein